MSNLTGTTMEVNMRLLQHALQGVVYPTNTGEMVEVAEFNFAPHSIIEMIANLGDSQYFSFIDVVQEIMYRHNDFEGTLDGSDDDDDDELYSSEYAFLDLRKEYF